MSAGCTQGTKCRWKGEGLSVRSSLEVGGQSGRICGEMTLLRLLGTIVEKTKRAIWELP